MSAPYFLISQYRPPSTSPAVIGRMMASFGLMPSIFCSTSSSSSSSSSSSCEFFDFLLGFAADDGRESDAKAPVTMGKRAEMMRWM